MIVSHPVNGSVGVGLGTGIETGLDLGVDYVVNIASDGQFARAETPKLLRSSLAHRADCITASRDKR